MWSKQFVKNFAGKSYQRHLGGRLEASSMKSRGTGSGYSERGKRSSSVTKRRGGRRGNTFKLAFELESESVTMKVKVIER